MIIFLCVLITYLFDKQGLYELMSRNISLGITPLHLLWFVFMIMMLVHIFPVDKISSKLSMALKKANQKYLIENNYEEIDLYRFIYNQNKRAWLVMLIWLVFNAFFGLFYLFGIMDTVDLLMLTVFYFICDYICILFFCPFQSFIMKNKCCINCRIYDWGHFMMFTPMLFIQDFFSWSLFFTSCIVLLRWEFIYASHPERFYEGSNKSLKCQNCKDKTCLIKRKVNSFIKKISN